jgi:hypothetical protein
MSTITVNLSDRAHVANTYASNVGSAARAFLAALLAVKPHQSAEVAAVRKKVASARTKTPGMLALYRMANQYDSVMPNFYSEMCFLASRG